MNARLHTRDNLADAYTSAFCIDYRPALRGVVMRRRDKRLTWKDSPARQASRKRRVAVGMADRVLGELLDACVSPDDFLAAFIIARRDRAA